MKTTETEKSVMQQLRDIRDKLSADIKDMTYKQLKEYLEKQKTLHPKTVWQKHDKVNSVRL
ncbi:MAG: hypothetical protein KG003_05575 [Bacteroidetes bacterium]|nr:hypothetical protein [Bacteroidota bacterium]